MSSNTVLLAVIVVMALLLFGSFGLIAYLMKRIIDEKPVAIQETVAAGAPPVVVTRADLKDARQYQKEQNFKEKSLDKFADLADLPPEMGMKLLEGLERGEE